MPTPDRAVEVAALRSEALGHFEAINAANTHDDWMAADASEKRLWQTFDSLCVLAQAGPSNVEQMMRILATVWGKGRTGPETEEEMFRRFATNICAALDAARQEEPR